MVFKLPCKQTYRISGRRITDTTLDHPDYGYSTVHSKVRKLNEKLNSMKLKSDIMREVLAEFLGTFILTLFGDAVGAAVLFSGAKDGGAAAVPIGWGLALMIAISVSGGVSGGHLNPAVSLAFASVGKMKWKKIIPYFCAQYAGAFVASIVLYAGYYDAISNFDGGIRELPPNASATAQIFATYPSPHVSVWGALADQIISTMVFMMAIIAITDFNNLNIPKSSYPALIGLSLGATIYAFPYNCGAPLNPARDFSPRVFTAIAGWGVEVFSFNNYTYFWVPILGPHIGAIIGAWVYKMSILLHWPVDSYDFPNPTEVKANGEFKKKDDLPFTDKKRISNPDRRVEE